MRSSKEFLSDIVRKPPILFPLVGLFHVLLLIWLIVSDKGVPFPGIVWLGPLWMLGYTVFWIAACDMRRWGALGYILLTLLNATIYLAARNKMINRDYLSDMFLVDGLFSVFLLFYYKRFR